MTGIVTWKHIPIYNCRVTYFYIISVTMNRLLFFLDVKVGNTDLVNTARCHVNKCIYLVNHGSLWC